MCKFVFDFVKIEDRHESYNNAFQILIYKLFFNHN